MVAFGSRGDVEPYLALSAGLTAAGHAVRFVTTTDFVGLATARGLDVVEIPVNIRQLLAGPGVRQQLTERGALRAFRAMSQLAAESHRLAEASATDAAAGSDLVVTGLGGHVAALAAARRHALPLVRAFNVPLTPTREFPGALFPGGPAGPGGLGHRLTQALSLAVVGATGSRSLRGLVDPFGLRAYPGRLLYGISPTLLPRPADWPAAIVQTGFWVNEPSPTWTPPADLQRFLDAGEPPVYVGFGSMTTGDPAAMTRLIVEASDRLGTRLVLSAGWAGLGQADVPATVHVAGDLPHTWLFPRTTVVVHHGGAGTTAAAVRAGVPQVVVPFHGDQPFWGRIVQQRGFGPAPLPHQRLDAVRLADAIRAARSATATAAAAGVRARSEDGVGDAVRELARGVR